MLRLDLSIRKSMGEYTLADRVIPCGPKNVLVMQLRCSGLPTLIATWCRIHTGRRRPNRIVNFVALGSALLLFLLLSGAALLAQIGDRQRPPAEIAAKALVSPRQAPPGPASAAPSAVAPPAPGSAAAPACLNCAPSQDPLPVAGIQITRLLWLGTPITLVLAVILGKVFRPHLLEVFIVALRPHDPLPSIEPFLARSRDKQVYAIRFLSEQTYERFYGCFVASRAAPPFRWRDCMKTRPSAPLPMTSVHVTHAGTHFGATGLAAAMAGYWSIARLGLGLMVQEQASSNARALGFTYKQHEWMLGLYFALLALATWLPATGLVPAETRTQFPLLMGGLGLLWTGAFLLLHRGLTAHLAEWERLTAKVPFQGCPVLRYSERDLATGCWEPVDLRAMRAPIRQLGLPGEKILEITLSLMLIIYLTVLTLIK